MKCDKLLTMLPEYADGEMWGADAEQIEQHLRACASCAGELDALRKTMQALGSAAEVEPPACLLAQIQAATIHRQGIAVRLQKVLDSLRSVPVYVRWAAGTSVAAAGLIVLLISQQSTPQSVAKSPSCPVHEESPSRVDMMKTLPHVALTAKPEADKPPVAMKRPLRRVHRPVRIARILPEKAPTSHKLEPMAQAVKIAAPDIASHADEPIAIAEMPKPVDDTPATAAAPENHISESTRVAAMLEQEKTSIKEFRETIAARNRRRSFDRPSEHLYDGKVELDIASVRF
jgi:hypothetical protein